MLTAMIAVSVGTASHAAILADGPVQPIAAKQGQYVTSELVIGFGAVPQAGAMAQVERVLGGPADWREIPHAPHPKNDPNGVHPLAMVRVLTLPEGVDPLAVAGAVRALEGVRYAHPNWLTEIAFEPNDPRWNQQCGPQAINAPAAWDITRGSSDIVIAVADTGLNFSHEEFQGNVYVNPDEIAGNGIDDDNNGYVDDINGRDCIDDTNNMTDGNGHGTHVSGTAAAPINNNLGIAGMSDSSVMVLQVFRSNGGGTWEAIAEAVFYATDNDADLLNYSGGGGGGDGLLSDAVDYAWDNGMPVVAAAGNNNSSSRFYPAAYTPVLAISGTDCNDGRYNNSNRGDWLDVGAPGVDILSSDVGGSSSYSTKTGTSMSSPHVSGLVALMLSLNGDLTPQEIRDLLRDNAVDLGDAGYDSLFGYGRVDSLATLLAVPSGCPADLDGDGDADADDFFDYLDAFAANDLAICNLDGDGDCDADDFFAYLDAFAGGC